MVSPLPTVHWHNKGHFRISLLDIREQDKCGRRARHIFTVFILCGVCWMLECRKIDLLINKYIREDTISFIILIGDKPVAIINCPGEVNVCCHFLTFNNIILCNFSCSSQLLSFVLFFKEVSLEEKGYFNEASSFLWQDKKMIVKSTRLIIWIHKSRTHALA